jgi:hypothetical protein
VRRLVAISVMSAFGFIGGCGEEETVADEEIVQALKLELSTDRPVYSIAGDPFCEVQEDLLNDESEVEEAKNADELGLVITDSEQTMGIHAVPPFDPKCESDARRALNKLGGD